MSIADNTSPAPNSRTIDLGSLVRQSWGVEFYQPDVIYRFSNGREFKSTDASNHGFYQP